MRQAGLSLWVVAHSTVVIYDDVEMARRRCLQFGNDHVEVAMADPARDLFIRSDDCVTVIS